MGMPQQPAAYNAGVGYPVNQVIDGNLTLVDVYGTGAYGNLTARSINAAFVNGVAPSGDTTGVTDTATIQGYLNQTGTVVLGSGKFYLNAPLTIPPYTALIGQFSTSQTTQTDGGTTLVITSGFTGKTITDGGPVTLTGAIVLLSQPFGGYSTVSEEQKIRNIMIDGTSGPASCQGIMSYGRLQRVHLAEILVSTVTGDGIQHNLDVAGNQPGAWYGHKVFSRFCGGKGFKLRSADSTWSLCLSSNNGDPSCDWLINTTSNSKYIGCRSEHSTAGVGFGYVCTNAGNSSGGVVFAGCSTDQSNLHGFQVGGTLGGVTNSAGVALTFAGCVFRRDGANGGSGGGNYAGFHNAGYPGQVTMTGLTIWPGVNDNGSGTNSPQIGLLADASSIMNVSAAYIQGATTAITDNSAGGINWDNSVVTATGTTSAPTITAKPNIAAYQGKSLTLTQSAAPSADPLQLVSFATGNRALGILVSGDTFDRVKITDQVIMLGPGNATQDAFLKRTAAGVLAADSSTNFAVDTAGFGLQVKEGSNAKQGIATLSSGTIVVSNTSVTANSRILLTPQDNNTTGALRVSARTAGTSFTITSSVGTDSGVVAYQIFEPA